LPLELAVAVQPLEETPTATQTLEVSATLPETPVTVMS
jgi:hypothetical protein